MQKYKKDHTDIKTCYALGIQNEILPKRFIREIPGSTSHYWKSKDPRKYIGEELSKGIQDKYSILFTLDIVLWETFLQ